METDGKSLDWLWTDGAACEDICWDGWMVNVRMSEVFECFLTTWLFLSARGGVQTVTDCLDASSATSQ